MITIADTMFGRKEQSPSPMEPRHSFDDLQTVFQEGLQSKQITLHLVKVGLMGLENTGHAENMEPETLYTKLTQLADVSQEYFHLNGDDASAEACEVIVEKYKTTLQGFKETNEWVAPKKSSSRDKAKQ